MISYYLFWERQIHAPQAVQSGSKPQAPQEDKELISASITFSVRYANTLSKTLPDSLFTVLLLRAPTRDTAPVTRDQRFASILPFLQTAIRQHRDAEMSVSSRKSPVSKEIWKSPCTEGMLHRVPVAPLAGQQSPYTMGNLSFLISLLAKFLSVL